jgi:putative membrane protein insertion efficiency factor
MLNHSWHRPCASVPMPAESVDRERGVSAPRRSLAGGILLALIAIYQKAVSPLLGPHCRFHPTCSNYAAEAIARYGPMAGTARALARLVRCHPLSQGGFDPVR